MTARRDIPAGRRIRAARAMRNVTVDELAEKLTGNGLSSRTLRTTEGLGRTAKPLELREIARVLDVPYAFFVGDPFDGEER